MANSPPGPAFTNVPMTATDTSTVVLGDTAYTHDANGNLTSDATFLYQYDLANQLTNVIRKSDSAVVLQCRYDALGRRVEAIRADGTVDRYVYFPGSFLVLAVLDETNAPKELYTRGPDLGGALGGAGGVGGICAVATSNAAVLYYHSDVIGNVLALSDTSSMILSIFHYSPFGLPVLTLSSPQSRFLFCSKEYDSVAGLYSYGYRDYSPSLARWISRDPIGTPTDEDDNLYWFVQNNPLYNVDMYGMESESMSDLSGGQITGKPNDLQAPPASASRCDLSACYEKCKKRFYRQTRHSASVTQQKRQCRENCEDARLRFLKWYEENRDLSWTKVLPRCPCRINCLEPGVWEDPTTNLHGYHAGATRCVRSRSVDGHATQCCYDQNGKLCTRGSGQGSVDKAAWDEGVIYFSHRSQDMVPADLANRLDGGKWGCWNEMYLLVRPQLGNDECPENTCNP